MRPIGAWAHTDVSRAASAVLEQLPASTTLAGLTLELRPDAARAGTFGRRARSVPLRWAQGRRAGTGHLEVAPLASDRAQLLLHLGPPAQWLPGEPATRLLELLRARLEGRVVPVARRAPRRAVLTPRRVAAVAAALATVPAVVLALSALSAPTPVSVDEQVARFRAEQATGGAVPAPSPDNGADPEVALVDDAPSATAADVERAPAPTDASTPPPPAADEAPAPPETDADLGEAPGDDEVAVARQEEAANPPAATSLRRPEPGVYRYTTSGGEQLDVRGSARDYPATTTVTVRHDACGFTERWDVFDERWEERSWCLEDDRRPLVGLTSYREFFGYGQRDELGCDGETPPAAAMEPGTRWRVVCADDDTTATTQVELVGTTPIEVGGETLDTLHLRLKTRVEGATSGHSEGQRWVVPETGLLVREQSETEVVTRGPVGPVTYTEQYTLHLESAGPSR